MPAVAWVIALCLAAQLSGGAALAQTGLLPIPALTGPLVDAAGVAAGPMHGHLLAELRAVQESSGVQLVVLTVPTLGGEGPAPYAHRVMEAWRLGAAGQDLGLLLLIVPGDRTTRLEVGYGLEGVLPDALAKQILADVLAPKGQGEALGAPNALRTVQVLHRLLDGAKARGELPQGPTSGPGAPGAAPLAQVPLWALALGVVAVLLLARYLLSFMPRDEGPGAKTAGPGYPPRAMSGRTVPNSAFWHMFVQLLLALLRGGGGRGGPPSGGGYSGGGGRSGGGGASDKY